MPPQDDLLLLTPKVLLLNRKAYEETSIVKFTKEELDLAEKNQDGFIGIQHGIKCYLSRCLFDNEWRSICKI